MGLKIGILAFQGSVAEHAAATCQAVQKLGIGCEINQVRTRAALAGLDGLIIPGGESTTMYRLCEREGMLDDLRNVRGIFGTCAGAVMLAREIHNPEAGQGTLGLMDITIDRNAYGSQAESFEEKLDTELGTINAIFIRAPKIRSVGKSVSVLAKSGDENVACEQCRGGSVYLATCFHPELSTTLFHERFLRALLSG